jgi:hypothetical protein
MWRSAAVGCALATLVAGCSKSHASSPPPPTAPAVAMTAAVPPAEGTHGGGKNGNGRFRDSYVYVDGKPIGVLRYSELPASLKPVAEPEIDDLDNPRYFKLPDYLQASGVDLARVREVQIYGSHGRIAVVQGDEIRTLRDRLVFDFTQQDHGKPRARWTQLHALPHRPMVDVIMGVAVYCSKTPPAPDGSGQLALDGKPIDEFDIPYVGDEIPKGTRVYVDGKLDGWVRRKQLADKLMAPGSDRVHAKFSLDAFLASLGVSARDAKAIDFLDGDDMVARIDGKRWTLEKSDYVFELPKRSHGKVKELFPGDKAARISSVQLYVHTTPPSREPDPAAFEQQGGGSDDAQDDTGNGGNTDVTGTAQGMNGAPQPSEDDGL